MPKGENVTRSNLARLLPEAERGDQERVVVPPLRPVVQIMDGGELRTLYGLQPQQNLAFSLTPLDREFDEPYPSHIGYGGAAGGGKSYLARATAVCAAFKWPGSTGIIFRKTRDEVRANHVEKFMVECPEKRNDGGHIHKYNGSEMVSRFWNGSLLYFGFLRDFADVTKYQGPEYDYMVFEESTHYDERTVKWLTGNRLRSTRPWCRPFALFPSNPGNVGHQWYKRWFVTCEYREEEEEYAEDFAFVQAKVSDNFVLQSRDPSYIRKLNTLPEPFRSWLRDGDWEAAMGLALAHILRREKHVIKPFRPPGHWFFFGAFDWGFAHPYSFGVYCVDEDGRVLKLDTIVGRNQVPDEFCPAISMRLSALGLKPKDLRYVAAGHDCWAERKARGENVPTIQETMQGWGFQLVQANISRITGLNNLRHWLQWEGMGPAGQHGRPPFQFMRTDGNLACFTQLENLPSDPDRLEDSLKIDADAFGQGGDDMYDETRYAMASRPRPAESLYFPELSSSPWSPEALLMEMNEQRKSKPPRDMHRDDERPLHPEFGGMY